MRLGQFAITLSAASTMGLASACSSPAEVSESVSAASTSDATSEAGDDLNQIEAAIGGKAKAAEFTDTAERDGGTRDFNYIWPARVSAIPELAQQLQQERDKDLAEQTAEWESALEEFSGEECTACKSRGYGKEWKVVADLPRFLSLSAEQYAYTGGAHGNYWFEALVWDRETRQSLDPRAMFTSAEALDAAVREPYCADLKAEQAKRRGGADAGDYFSNCPPVEDLTVLVGSSDGKSFNRIGLLAAPYVAGPYVEGSYEVTVPVTEAVLETVKPDYRASFAIQ